MRKGVSAQGKQHGRIIHARGVLLFHLLRLGNPFGRSEEGWDPSATSSQTTPDAPRARGENDSADGRSRIHARGSSGLQRALAERRVRITPAAPGALIRFHPRGKDVVLTCTGRYRTSLREGARRCLCCCVCLVRSPIFLSPREKRINPRRLRRPPRADVNPH